MKTKLTMKIAVVVLFCMGLLMSNVTSFAAAPAEAGVYFINLGQKGNATLIKTISGTTASYGLVDTGLSADFTTYVQPYLTSVLGSTKLSFIAFSHMHGDHAGGAEAAIANFADANTTLYIKDVADPDSTYSGESSIGTRADAIIAAAKAKNMPIGKISLMKPSTVILDPYQSLEVYPLTNSRPKLRGLLKMHKAAMYPLAYMMLLHLVNLL